VRLPRVRHIRLASLNAIHSENVFITLALFPGRFSSSSFSSFLLRSFTPLNPHSFDSFHNLTALFRYT
jgi:hypothetical protein